MTSPSEPLVQISYNLSVITGNLNVIPDARVRNVISKGPKYKFPSKINFPKSLREIAVSLNDFSNGWCKQENVESDALKEWKINVFKIIDTRISFSSRNTHLLPPKPKFSFPHLNPEFSYELCFASNRYSC